MLEMKPSSKEYRKAIGRARTLVRRDLGNFPGAPIVARASMNGKMVQPATDSAQLAWLYWPDADGGEIGCQPITLETIGNWRQAFKKLTTFYRSYLDEILSEPDRWLAGIQTAIEEIERTFRKGTYWPEISQFDLSRVVGLLDRLPIARRWRDAAIKIVRQHPSLSEFISALTWLETTRIHPSKPALLEWVQKNASELAQLSTNCVTDVLRTQLSFCLLHDRVDARLLEFLLQALGAETVAKSESDLSQPLFVHRLSSTLQNAIKHHKPPSIAEPSVRTPIWVKIEELLHWMLRQDAANLKPWSCLLGELCSQDLLLRDDDFVNSLNAEAHRLKREITRMAAIGAKQYLNDLGAKAPHVACTPIPSNQISLTSQLLKIAKRLKTYIGLREKMRQLGELVSSLTALNVEHRIAIACNWLSAIDYSFQFAEFVQSAQPFAKLFHRRGVHSALLEAFQQPCNKGDWLFQTARGLKSPRDMKHFADSVESLIYDQGYVLCHGQLDDLAQICAGSKDLQWSVKFARENLNQLTWTTDSRSTYEFLYKLDPSATYSLRLHSFLAANYAVSACSHSLMNELPWKNIRETLLSQFLAGNSQNIMKLEGLAHIAKALRLADQLLAKKLASTPHSGSASQIGPLAAQLEKIEPNRPTLQTETAVSQPVDNDLHDNVRWIEGYPLELRPHLKRLQLVAGSVAQTWATKKLKKNCPSADSISQELNQLHLLLNDTQLAENRKIWLSTRQANLQQRLARLQPISPRRLNNLQAKIEARIFDYIARNLKAELIESLKSKLSLLGITKVVDQLFQPPYSQILPAIFELPEPNRTIGLRVLAKGIQSPELFLDEPENRRYIERVAGLGVNIQAWLHPSTVVDARRKDGTAYQVAFATSSLEIFLMGYHFQTCLSPDNINFYSTIANVADVNKRVIFGRTKDGTVVGRCLVCLNEYGQIQVFYRYCHDSEDKFDTAVDAFLTQLAKAMNTSLTARGRIARLVVRQWYDDGCCEVPTTTEDTINTFEAQVVPILRQAPTNWAVEWVEKELGDRSAVLSHLNELVEFIYAHRRRLAPHCLKWLGNDSSRKNLQCRLILAGLVRDQGEPGLAGSAVNQIEFGALIHQLSRQQWGGLLARPCVLHMFAEIQPVLTLRLLRLTRAPNMRSDLEEVDQHRRQVLHQINKKLFRHKRALALSSA